MNKTRSYPWIGAVVGAVIGLVVVSMLENRTGFLFYESLLNLVIISAAIGASIGVTADMLGKGEIFTDSISGMISSMVYGAAIGAVADPKFSQPIPRAIAGAIAGAIAVVLYNKLIVRYFANKNREVNAGVYVVFGIIIGAFYGALTLSVDVLYNAIFFSAIIKANGYSINDYMVNTMYSGIGIGIIIGGIFGAIFGAFFGAIHSTIGGKGAAGGAIAGAIVIGEVFQSVSGVILGVFGGAIMVAIGSKGRMRSMVAGGTIGASAGAFSSAVGMFAAIPPYISLIFIISAFLIIGYRAGMIIADNKFRRLLDTAPGVR